MIEVINPGFFTTVQDEGRFGYQAFGLPVAGVMDDYASRAANILAGNAPCAAVLEMTMMGGAFYFAKDSYVAVCGADMQGELNNKPVRSWSGFFVPGGSELKFKSSPNGSRTYLAVNGGIDTPPVMGSRATFIRGGVGGFEGRALKAGDKIPVGKSAKRPVMSVALPDEFIPEYKKEIVVRAMLGPQDDLFTQEGIDTFFGSEYTASADSDRMGCRLEGETPIKHLDKPDIVSDALCRGNIQVPGHGMPIVMLADRQTTGGYTKIATVIGADLWKMAQVSPGNKIRFIKTSDEEAVKAFHERLDALEKIKKFAAAAASPAKNIASGAFNLSINGVNYSVEIKEGGNK
jgi:biotin-dependent carboxylase-like uncharacterized protein